MYVLSTEDKNNDKKLKIFYIIMCISIVPVKNNI